MHKDAEVTTRNLQETGVTQMGGKLSQIRTRWGGGSGCWIQVVECRLHDSNMGQVHTWRFLRVCLRACCRAAVVW